MKKTLLSFLIDQWTMVPAVEVADLTGKTAVVVGANTGIGFEAAMHFARMNPAKLVLACRSESKGKAAVSAIVSATGCKTCELRIVDLANFASVTGFAERFEREYARLDILVMNAGVGVMEYEATRDGWESSLQVNHLGTALLSLLLLPHLVETGRKFQSSSRLIYVASEAHYWIDLVEEVKTSPNPVAVLNSPKYRDVLAMARGRRYGETKLLNVLFARALQDRLQSITPLTVNAVNPGFCYSNLRRNVRGLFTSAFVFVMEICVAWTAEQGSRQLVYAAVGEKNDEDRMKGAYVSKAAVVEPSDFVMSAEGRVMQDNLWRETVDILTREASGLKSIVEEYLAV